MLDAWAGGGAGGADANANTGGFGLVLEGLVGLGVGDE